MQPYYQMKTFWEQYECDRTKSLDTKGQGSVYAAIDQQTGAAVAIKVIEVQQVFDEQGQLEQRWNRALSLKNAHLLSYQKVERYPDNNIVYYAIVMPLLEQGSLDKFQPQQLTPTQRNDIWRGVLDALLYLHQQGLVHQQIHASHILLHQTQDLFFPLLIQHGAANKIPIAFFTNYEYLAPEQLQPESPIDARTDIWAVGVLGYWLWTGQLPFGQKTPQHPNRNIQQRILRDDLPELLEAVEEPFQTMIRRCLSKSPDQRWQSVQELLGYWQQAASVVVTQIPEKETVATNAPFALMTKEIKRVPSRPIQWWAVVLGLVLASVLGYWVNQLAN